MNRLRRPRALDPERLPIVGTESRNLRDVEFDWLQGWDLRNGEPVWIPADAVYFRSGPTPPWSLSSNGLASGNCLVEALAHALAELIERDALTLYKLATDYSHLPNLVSFIAGPPRLPPPEQFAPAPNLRYPFVDHDTLPGPLQEIVERIKQSKVCVDLRWAACDTSVPVFLCVIHEAYGSSMSLTHAGSGAHPDACVAARRAVTEACQTRVTYIHGVREDLHHPALREQHAPSDGWFSADVPRVDFSTLPTYVHVDIRDDLRWMADALGGMGLHEVLAVDISHPDIPFTVVKVLVPGLEALLDFRIRDRVALGWRARRFLQNKAREVVA